MIDFAQYMEPVARRLLGEPNRALSTPSQWRYGTHGSMAVEVAGQNGGKWYDHERKIGGGVLDLVRDRLGLSNGAAVDWLKAELDIRLDERPEPVRQRRLIAEYDYRDEDGELLFQVVRYDPKEFRQRRPDGKGGWDWSARGARQVPYRLSAILERHEGCPVYICEGEKDADRLASLGLARISHPVPGESGCEGVRVWWRRFWHGAAGRGEAASRYGSMPKAVAT